MYKGLFTFYQYEFHSGMSFVPEWSSYCIHMTKSTGSAVLKTKTIKQHAPEYTACVFISERSSFSVYIIPEWNVIPEREFHSDWKPEWTHSGMTCAGTKFVSVSCKTDTEKYMGMEWSRSGMTIIPISCERPLSSGTATRQWTKSGQISRERPHKMPGNAEA